MLYFVFNQRIYMNTYVYYVGTFFWTAKNQVCSEIEKQPLANKAECKSAAMSGNLQYWEIDSDSPLFPTGCFQISSVFWNSNKNGTKHFQATAICKDMGGCIIFISFVADRNVL